MDLDAALSLVRDHRQGVLVTQKRDGRPRLSNRQAKLSGRRLVLRLCPTHAYGMLRPS